MLPDLRAAVAEGSTLKVVARRSFAVPLSPPCVIWTRGGREEVESRMRHFAPKPEGVQLLSAVSELVTRTYARHTGTSPAKARSYCRDDVLMCVLRDTLTADEKHLLASGSASDVHTKRLRMQEGMKDELVAGVEELTGRRVKDLITAHDIDPEFASETFVLDAREIFLLNGLVAGCGSPGVMEPQPV
jgi:uncharacterized protein YbcI